VEVVVVRILSVVVLQGEKEADKSPSGDEKSIQQIPLLVDFEVDAREHPVLDDVFAGLEHVQAPGVDVRQLLQDRKRTRKNQIFLLHCGLKFCDVTG
jgi:hypothetical protein